MTLGLKEKAQIKSSHNSSYFILVDYGWDGIDIEEYYFLQEALDKYEKFLNQKELKTSSEILGVALIEGKIIRNNDFKFKIE